jgi:hypothetical protein
MMKAIAIVGAVIGVIAVLLTAKISSDPNEVYDYRCRANGMIYEDKDYLMAAMPDFLDLQRYFADEEKNKNEYRHASVYDSKMDRWREYKLHFNKNDYDSYESFIAAFPDCCRASRLPSDDDLDVANENNNSYIRVMRRDGMLASFVTISHKAKGVSQDGDIKTVKMSYEYEVGNCLEVRRSRAGEPDWKMWPNNLWIIWLAWRPSWEEGGPGHTTVVKNTEIRK